VAVAADAGSLWGIGFVGMIATLGMVGKRGRRRNRRRKARPPKKADARRLRDRVERLCALADLPPPEVTARRERAPLSWTVAVPLRRPTVYVTTALLDEVSDDELDAVLAHELAHIANRDAVLTTAISLPGIGVLRGLGQLWHEDWRGKFGLLTFGPFLALPALPFALLARVVTRHREFAADRAAAAITGRPAMFANVLQRLSGRLDALPDADLRVVAARDGLHILPARRARLWLWSTHPPLEKRLEQLERLERTRHVPLMPSPSAPE
jgi:heat shock protein HtpX